MSSSHSLSETFLSLFDDPESRRLVEQYRPYARLHTFNLTATSLRHIQKWYDRLSDINQGIHRPHGNYYPDPISFGLVTKTGTTSAILTPAGREFLETASEYYDNPQAAEYALNKALYYSGHDLGNATAKVAMKQRNLYEFLRMCRPTHNTRLVLENNHLLTLAEILASFGSALERFLLLDPSELVAFAELGELGFHSLFEGQEVNPGYIHLANKIGSDYPRASIRRRNYLFSHLFLELRQRLILSGSQVLPLMVPYPFRNLVSEQLVAETAYQFTNDIAIDVEDGGYIMILREAISGLPLPPPSRRVQLGERRRRDRPSRVGAGRPARRRSTEPYTVEAPFSVEAEDHVEAMLRESHGEAVRRVGHTQLETVQLDDGLLPGADIIIEDSEGRPVRFVEVKSARTDSPYSISLTAAEYERAVKCLADGIPYDIYVVSFVEGLPYPLVSIWYDAQQSIAQLTIQELLSFVVPLQFS